MEAIQRHKRTFTEMSQSATLSPSPHTFGDSAASNFRPPRRVQARESSEHLDHYHDRRRTPHPHNPPYLRASQEMAEQARPQRPPRLERQASQTIIDLTDDNDEVLHFQPARVERRSGPLRPPQLGRRNAALIDLTMDEEDIVIVGERQRTPPRPAAVRPSPPVLPGLFVDRVPNMRHGALGGDVLNGHDGDDGPFNILAFLGARRGPGLLRGIHDMQFRGQLYRPPPIDLNQPMPGVLDYEHGAFENRKPEHQAPPPPRENFTRSPAEEDTIICPSCEQELIHDKDAEGPVIKKNGKATRKDREEHPFWVVRECGHVYCNSCFQLRSHANTKPNASFRSDTGSTKSKSLRCAVEDCEADVKEKGKWVGVFL